MSDVGCANSKDENNFEEQRFDPGTRNQSVTEDLDTACDLLARAHRRYLLYYLSSLDGTATDLDAAASAVRRYEAAGTETADPASRETIEIALHHNHLPRLADSGHCEYDPQQGTIRFTPSRTLAELIEQFRRTELE